VDISEKVDQLRSSDVFSAVPIEALQELGAVSELIRIDAGDYLIRENEESRDLFLVVDGRAVAVGRQRDANAEVVYGHIADGDVVGEIQALTGGKRTASVRAETAMSALRLPSKDFEQVAREHIVTLQALSRYIRDRHLRNVLRAALRSRYYIKDEHVIGQIEDAVEWKHLDRGDVVARQGEESDAVSFLLSGRLEAVSETDNRMRRISEILPGEAAGETVVMRGEASDATVSATRPSEIARIPRKAFGALLASHPVLARGLLEVMLNRFLHPEQKMHSGQTVAVLPIGRGLSASDLVRQVVQAADPDLRSIVIDRPLVQHRFGAPDLSQIDTRDPMALRLTTWLEQVESKHELVVYEVDRSDSAWARRCTGIAEEIVLLARATDDPRPTAEERRLLDPAQWVVRPHVTLVLLHETDRAPSDTAAWLSERTVDTVLHLRRSEPGDIGRLARFVTRRAVGVVMSGGASRGWAAVGVLQALEEMGVPVDAVGGVSGGAFIAAMYAIGMSPEGILTAILDPSGAKQFGLGFPTVSLLSAKRMIKFFRGLWGNIQIEDLWRPCFFVSTNLTQATQRMATRGDLIENMLASNAMPPIFPPFDLDGDLCVDGAFVNNVPISEMAGVVRGGPVIAVDVTPSVTSEDAQPRTGKSLVPRRLRDALQMDEPHVIESLLRCQLVHHVEHMRTAQKAATLYIAPDVRQFSLLAHTRARDIARAGHDQSVEPIRAWWSQHTSNLRIVQESRAALKLLDLDV
jgi:NTE family protein/lysophospholipid hydrolase